MAPQDSTQLCAEAETQLQKKDAEAAVEAARAALSNSKKAQDFRGAADATRLLGQAYLLEVESLKKDAHFGVQKNISDTFKKAYGVCGKELDYFRENQNKYGEACMLLNLAELNAAQPGSGQGELATDHANEALDIFKELQDTVKQAQTLMVLHDCAAKESRTQEATYFADQAMALVGQNQDVELRFKAIERVAKSEAMKKDLLSAIATMMQALSIARDAGKKKLEASCLETIAAWQLARERPRESLPPAKEAMSIYEEIGTDATWDGEAMKTLIEAQLMMGVPNAALREATAALGVYKESKQWKLESLMHQMLARINVALGDHPEALKHGDEAYAVIAESYDVALKASVLNTCCEVFEHIKYFEHASYCCQEVLAIERARGNTMGELNTLIKQGLFASFLEKDLGKEFGKTLEKCFFEVYAGARRGDALIAMAKADPTEHGVQMAHEAVGVFHDAGDKISEAEAWKTVCLLTAAKGQFKDAVEAATRRRKLLQQSDKATTAARSYALEAEMQCSQKDFINAMKSAWHGQLACKTAEDKEGEIQALILVLKTAAGAIEKNAASVDQKSKDKAFRAAQEAKKIGNKLLDVHLPRSIFWHAKLTAATNEVEEAMEIVDEAIPMYEELKDVAGLADAQLFIAECHFDLQQKDKAIAVAEKALKNYNEAESDDGAAAAVKFLASLGVMAGGGMMPMGGGMMPMMPAAPRHRGGGASSGAVVARGPRLTEEVVKSRLIELAASVVVDEKALSLDVALMDAGIDSLAAVSFRNEVAKEFEVSLSPSLIFDYPTLDSIQSLIMSIVDEEAR